MVEAAKRQEPDFWLSEHTIKDLARPLITSLGGWRPALNADLSRGTGSGCLAIRGQAYSRITMPPLRDRAC